ncbi:hypothetical protein [Caldimonas tepidiphila]|uniref:hypothetical protein n=1 Tax=Caldimonas tepidiphila TaxID=2315841 RepID=UPI000E5B18D7|nr:hypothetical protein [Caldimonas tepidiphila]
MSDPIQKFSVVLRSELPARERALLEKWCCRVPGDAEPPMLQFLCTEIDETHAHYLEMRTFRPGEPQLRSIRIPHAFVLLISGSRDHPPIGFLAGDGGDAD